MSKRILTGLRANSKLHIGNYIGAIKPMVNLQKQLRVGDSLFMFVPDLHSFTTPIDHSELFENTVENMRTFIACGIDPKNDQTVLYRQSHIPAHAELTWILDCFTYMGEASRMTEFKDKSARLGEKSISVGLFNYPILMAADILLYGANYVPLGDDQKQHMELARTLAERMNNKFDDNLFVVPKPWAEQLKFASRDQSMRIRSLTNPDKKMSKSVDDPKGTIALNDDPSEAKKKVMGAATDSQGTVNFDYDNQPGVTNLMVIASELSGNSLEEVKAAWVGKTSYGDLKSYVAEQVESFLESFQNAYKETDFEQTISFLEAGEEHATAVAQAQLIKVQQALGLRR